VFSRRALRASRQCACPADCDTRAVHERRSCRRKVQQIRRRCRHALRETAIAVLPKLDQVSRHRWRFWMTSSRRARYDPSGSRSRRSVSVTDWTDGSWHVTNKKLRTPRFRFTFRRCRVGWGRFDPGVVMLFVDNRRFPWFFTCARARAFTIPYACPPVPGGMVGVGFIWSDTDHTGNRPLNAIKFNVTTTVVGVWLCTIVDIRIEIFSLSWRHPFIVLL